MENDFLLNTDNIIFEKKLVKKSNITTYEATLISNQSKCISKKIKNIFDSKGENKIHDYIKILQDLQHPGIIQFLGYIPSNQNENEKTVLLFKYAQNSSFRNILQDKNQKDHPFWSNKTNVYMAIYGIAQTMKYLHDYPIVHERLTSSNILFDENYEPKITDFYLSSISSQNKTDPNNSDQNSQITDKSDVYAFALFILQILSENECDISDDNIQNTLLQNLTQKYPSELLSLIISCLDVNSDNRPTFQAICDILDSIIEKMPDINLNQFEKYKKKLTQRDHALKKKELLAYDSFFDESNDEVINNILKEIDQIVLQRKNNKEEFTANTKNIEEQNFIVTDLSKENIQILSRYMEMGIPVLLEGETGTSKTLTAETVCELYGYELIRFNLSSETRIADLFGRYFGDENSYSGISYKDGPFFKAFSEGKVFLLDEINLASASVLQCIEEALDSGSLSVEIPGKPLKKKVKMNKKFRLLATQNPNKGSYANKRQNLGQKFYSRFQIINFPQFKENELLNIAQGLANRFGCKDNCITDLVSFHKRWSEMSDDIQCFTIREIAATIKAISKNESIYDTIMTIYGARYEKQTKEKLIEFLNKNYPSLCNDSKEQHYPKFDDCYMNKSLESVIKSVLFSLNNGRNVIITGKKGCGKTQVALWISEYYNKNVSLKEEHKKYENVSFFCFCSEEIKVADLIGHQAPSGNSDGTNELIKWQEGFLTIALELGKCAVLESIDEAPPTVTERLNGLLDKKYDQKAKYFDVPENSSCPRVKIEDSFRILGTSDIDKIQQMSQAFLNRFDVIVLENQMDDINNVQFKELITTLLNKHSTDLQKEMKICDETKTEQIIKYCNSDNIVSIIHEKVKNDKNISNISKICNSIIKLSDFFKKNQKITESQIVEFTFNILFNNKNSTIPEEIEKELLNSLQSFNNKFEQKINIEKTDNDNSDNELDDNITGYNAIDTTDEPFFYENSPSLRSYMAKLNAYSIIQQPLCVVGPTGVGKTSAARAFARMRKSKSRSNCGFQMHSFHSGTKVSHFFGSTTLQDGKIVFHDGTLTEALKNGLVFIADEFNLSSTSVMKSLSLALDPTIGKNVFIPGIGEIINIYPGFHFIACQNDTGTLGRNAIPDSIKNRFVEIDYPTPENYEIEDICVKIYRENFTEKKLFEDEDEMFARNTSKYMMKLNEVIKIKSNLFYISPWSLRDISKLFRRIYSQNESDVININPIHHVLFYTMSIVPPKFENKVINDVCSIIKQSYGQKIAIDEYINCFNAEPIIIDNDDKQGFVMKGNSGIRIENYEKLKDKKLPSLFNAIFKISLANKREPLLIMGNSGYKTFLAQLFLPRAQIIILNQETNINQLLGSSGFMTKAEAKMFYIDYICKILRNDLMSKQLKKDYEEGNLSEEKVYNLILEGKNGIVPVSFYYALENFYEKLFQEQNDDSALSNTVLEFRPGLFLNTILQGQSLILKDLPNLPTIVLERFNELFSGKQNITLSEDIHDTFTSPYEKELTNFNDYFRVFALGPENSSSKLSEAVLSRFTSIAVSEYSTKEQMIVLESYIEINKLSFNHDLKQLDKFMGDFSNIGLHITFPQLIKIVEITSKLDQQVSSRKHRNSNLEMTLYRVLGGMLESRERRAFLLNKIKNVFDNQDIYKMPKELEQNLSCCLIIEQNNNYNGVKSLISNLFINCSTAKECINDVAYTDSFNDLLDVLHMGLSIHNPILLEGYPGQGKHTAINCIAEMLNMNITRITISQSTKVEDLFGKDSIVSKPDGIHIEMRETDLIKIIKASNYSEKRSLIILENINAASQAILNALVPVFSSHSSSILLPNGSTIEKGIFDIIGIFNPQISSRDKLPSSLINSSIYHIVSKPNKDEVSDIISIKFELENLPDQEATNFNDYYNKAKDIASKEGYSSEIFTLNDIDKYILFRKLSSKVFDDEKTIVQMLFAYRFSSDKMIGKIIEGLELGIMKFQPIFGYNSEKTHLFIKLSNDCTNQILIPLFKSPKNISKLSAIDCLTLPQKHCLIFTALSILTNRACVIQGDTASGKTHIIYLISKLVGAKLNVIQMNTDCSLAMLAGQSVLNNELTSKDRKYLKKIFIDICIDKQINDYFKRKDTIDINNENTWTPAKLKKLIRFISSILHQIQEKIYYPEIKMGLFLIRRIMSPVNRFMQDTSTFINAIKNGEWVLIDGIESAPPTVAEKLSSLCGENPELNLYEFGPEFYFSTDKIHKNFRLFITYNPNGVKESQMMDLTFLVKSMTFTLPPIDDTEKNSAQVLLGSFINLSFEPTLSKQLAARFAHMHINKKLLSQNNPEKFTGDKQYNGRTLKFIIQALSSKRDKKNIPELICFIIESFYLKSFVDVDNADEFLLSCVNDFKEKPSDDLLDYLFLSDNDPRKRNKEVLIVLRNIQKYVLGLYDSNNFILSDFLNSCSYITLYDLQYIANHIKITNSLIESKLNGNDSPKNYFIKYGSLLPISTILEQIINPNSTVKKEHAFLCLNDQDLKSNDSIVLSLLQFDLLRYLSNNKLFSENCSIILKNKTNIIVLSKVYDIVTKNSKQSLIELYSIIEQNNDLINYVMKIFPFMKIKQSMICYWLPLSQLLIEKGVRFSYTINNNKFEFNKKSTCCFSVDLLMNEKDNFSLSINSIINYDNNKEKLVLYNKNEEKLYYTIITILAQKPNENISYKAMMTYKNQYNYKTIDNPFLNSILSLNQLFNDQNSILISLIWNIVYTLPDTVIKQLSSILNPIESELLLLHFNIFKSMNLTNFDDVIELAKWSKAFDNETNILKQIIFDINFNKNNSNTDEVIKNIEKEIRYFKCAPQSLNKFWSSDSLIKLYQSKLDEYNIIQENEEKKSQELTNKKTIKSLIDKLYDSNVSYEYDQLKKDLINQLGLITEYSDSICNCATKIVKQFITDSSLKEINKNNIIWPDISPNQSHSHYSYKSDNIKLFDELIWYSRVKSIITELIKGNNIVNNLRKLDEFKEMACTREIFLKSIIKNPLSNDKINYDSALNTLNANMIFKLYNINPEFLSKPDKIYEIINNYRNRYFIPNEEFEWVYSNSKKYSSDLLLSIPKFEPNDIIYLIIDRKSDDNYSKGPLFKGIYYDNFFINIKKLLNEKFNSYFKIACSIAEITYSTCIEKKEITFEHFDDMKKVFDENRKLTYEEKNIINSIKKLIESI